MFVILIHGRNEGGWRVTWWYWCYSPASWLLLDSSFWSMYSVSFVSLLPHCLLYKTSVTFNIGIKLFHNMSHLFLPVRKLKKRFLRKVLLTNDFLHQGINVADSSNNDRRRLNGWLNKLFSGGVLPARNQVSGWIHLSTTFLAFVWHTLDVFASLLKLLRTLEVVPDNSILTSNNVREW